MTLSCVNPSRGGIYRFRTVKTLTERVKFRFFVEGKVGCGLYPYGIGRALDPRREWAPISDTSFGRNILAFVEALMSSRAIGRVKSARGSVRNAVVQTVEQLESRTLLSGVLT